MLLELSRSVVVSLDGGGYICRVASKEPKHIFSLCFSVCVCGGGRGMWAFLGAGG